MLQPGHRRKKKQWQGRQLKEMKATYSTKFVEKQTALQQCKQLYTMCSSLLTLANERNECSLAVTIKNVTTLCFIM